MVHDLEQRTDDRRAFSERVDQWRTWLGERAQGSTVAKYVAAVEAWGVWADARGVDVFSPPLGDMELWSVRMRFDGQASRSGSVPSASTVKADRTALRGFYKWAFDREYVEWGRDITPLFQPPKVADSEPNPVEDEVYWRFIERPCWSVKLKVAFGFAFFCGLRANEIGGLRPGDVDFDGEFIEERGLSAGGLRVDRKGGKIQVLPWLLMAHWISVQQVAAGWPMVEPELAVWKRHVRRMCADAVDQGRVWLFDWHLSASGVPAVSNCVNKRLEYHGADDVGLHRCRHSFVTNLGRAGFSAEAIKDLVGHASVSTTMRYLDANKVAADQLRLGPPGWRMGGRPDMQAIIC